jgi:hypothetical protein
MKDMTRRLCELGVKITQIWRTAIGRRNIELLEVQKSHELGLDNM